MAKITIKAEYARLIQPFQSTEETRYYLNGFYLHADPVEGARIVATDGHRLAVFHDESATGAAAEGVIVSLDKLQIKALKAERGEVRYLVIDTKADTATVWAGDPRETDAATNRLHRQIAQFSKILVDGTFPDYHRIMPRLDDRPFVAQAYNANYLRLFGEVSEDRSRTIYVMAQDMGAPAIVLTARDDFFGVVMPIRSSRVTLPDFWTRPARAPAQAKEAADAS